MIAIDNDFVAEAVTEFPEYFRAGSIGPDGFPDLIAGQLWVHVNNGKENGGLDSSVPFEQRNVDQWRSVDYGMFQQCLSG